MLRLLHQVFASQLTHQYLRTFTLIMLIQNQNFRPENREQRSHFENKIGMAQ